MRPGLGLPKAVEDVRQLRGIDARSGVADREPDRPRHAAGREHDELPRRAELDGVVEQVKQDLHHAIAVADQPRAAHLIVVDVHMDVPRAGARLDERRGLLEQGLRSYGRSSIDKRPIRRSSSSRRSSTKRFIA